jgi:hypothetical protein
MPRGEAPDPGQQPTVGQRPQIAAPGMRLPVQRLPGYGFKAHEITVKPQQWMRSTASRGADSRQIGFDLAHPGQIDAPWLIDLDVLVEIP